MKKKENEYFVYVIHREEPKPQEAELKPKEKQKKPFSIFGMKKKEEKSQAGPGPEVKEKPAEFGTVETRPIKLGYMTQDLVEVEEGLAEDDMIIVEVQEDFKDKARVEVSEVQEGLI